MLSCLRNFLFTETFSPFEKMPRVLIKEEFSDYKTKSLSKDFFGKSL